MRPSDRLPLGCLLAAVAVTALSRIGARDPSTWLMEVAPTLIALPVLVATYRRFRFTSLVYVALAIHAAILATGGHWTYAEVPLGFWFRDALGLARNHYDRLGHLAQGFVPALVTRELLLRTSPLRRGGWLLTLVTLSILGVSACYEFIEWWAALLLGQGADAFLGSQGDPWDTQWDMFMALCGALLAQLALGRWHDRLIASLPPHPSSTRFRPADLAR
jgi:putative membrane protein